ncbi:LPXTG cell wall anchor domain-containing protein [Halalkalibacter hemicellulosilyticus]
MIRFEYELQRAIRNLQAALDQLEEIVDLGPGLRFDFGAANSPLANGYTKVTDTTVYDEVIGFGFRQNTDGTRDQGGPDDLRRDFILANNSEFIVDLPDGEYDVKVITGAYTDSNDTTVVFEGGDPVGGARTEAGEFAVYEQTVIVSDGQLNIEFSGQWARINAVEIVNVNDFNVKFDFGSEGSPVAYGFKQVSNTMEYSEERGYGLNKQVAERDRGGPDDIRRDFVIDNDFEFIVDLRNVTYRLHIIAGDDIASNTSIFSVDGEEIGRIGSSAGQYGELIEEVIVTDNQLVLSISQRINGLEIFYVPEDEEKPTIDTSELKELITKAKSISIEDGTYTVESYEALQAAIAEAEERLTEIESEEELAEAIATLELAVDRLEEVEELVPPTPIDTTELEELITKAKSISNENGTYTTESFAALQAAIEEAQGRLVEIESEEELAEVIAMLQAALDGLAEDSDRVEAGSEENPVKGDDQSLPQTATNLFNGLIIGLIVLIAGFSLLFAYRRFAR